MHRHNSCRAYPAEHDAGRDDVRDTGQAVLLPGTHRTSSYLAVAGDDARPQPALGLPRRRHRGLRPRAAGACRTPHPEGHATRRFRYSDEAPTDAEHFDDNGVNAALDVLVRNGLVRPVARMRPLAVLH